MNNLCPHCGAPITPGAATCEYCNNPLNPQPAQPTGYRPPVQPVQPQPTVVVQQQPVYQYVGNPAINPAWPIKSKVAAALLAIFLGSLGIHKFYLGKTGMGILYLIFCWTGIPSLVGFIEGILYLTSNDENFQLKHHVRIG